MRYLRMLSNSVFAGLLASVYLTLLLLHLNPSVPLTAHAAGPLFTVIDGVVRPAHRRGVVRAVRAPADRDRRALVAGLDQPASADVERRRAERHGGGDHVAPCVGSAERARLRGRCRPSSMRRRRLRQRRWCFCCSGSRRSPRDGVIGRRSRSCSRSRRSASIVVPALAARPAARPPARAVAARARSTRSRVCTGARVVLLCLDGASLDVISPAVAAGRLPNFGRLLDRGASMHLATTRPTQPEPVWASVMTGMWPSRHGVRGAARYRPFNGDVAVDVLPDYLFSQALIRLGLLIEEPVLVRESRESCRCGRLPAATACPPGLIGLPLTHPADSPRRLHRQRPVPSPDRQCGRPRCAAGRLAAQASTMSRARCWPRSRGSRPARAALASICCRRPARADRRSKPIVCIIFSPSSSARPSRCGCLPCATPGSMRSATTTCATRIPMPMAMCPKRSAGSSAACSTTTTRTSIRSSATRWPSLGENDLLLVVSGFGMEPLTFGKRLLERVVGDPRFTGTHERAPDGFLLAYGIGRRARAAGARRGRGRRADAAVFPRPSSRARHGRLRTHRSLHSRVQRTAHDHVYSVI